jgi:DNA repair protein RecN (Recombination protein N)
MLSHLLIKNYALIRHLEINPHNGLNIVTGETGAGKSIMLGALGLLMGNRADVKALFDESEKCVVEGSFDIRKLQLQYFFEENELDFENLCLIRREVSPSGKSRAFINDTPVTLDVLKNLGVLLMDIHSQHDTLLLGSNSYQLSILDGFVQNQSLFENYKQSYKTFKKVEKLLADVQEKAASLKKELDYHLFLYSELEEARLSADEQAELEEQLLELENAEELKRKLLMAFEYLNNSEISALSLIKDANSALGSISGIAEKYKALKDRLNSSFIEIQDISDEIASTEEKIETDEERLVLVRDRLNLIFKLQTKHGVKTVSDLLQIQAGLKSQIEKVGNLDNEITNLTAEKERVFEIVTNLSKELTASRIGGTELLSKKIKGVLIDLGMPDAQLEILHKFKDLGSEGADEIAFGFSANKGSSLKSLKEVASGGEFSRLMLAIKYIMAEKRQLPTIIFDEIDAGISGEVAIKVGKILTEMARKLQVLAITHLHQIAGRGQVHFYVYKDNSAEKTVSLMKEIAGNERIMEIAKMIGGEKPSDFAIASALEMLENQN